MARVVKSFEAILPHAPKIEILDIGSNPNERHIAPPSYAGLLERKRCRITGFEPGTEAFAALQKIQSPEERYFPYAIGDGTTQKFYECALGVMSSLYEPNHELLKDFHVLGEAARVVAVHEMPTKRLDDISEITTCDYIHMDIQGAELQALKSGEKLLKNVVVVQAEVTFLQMYRNQPTFSEVELYMRSQGFMLHYVDSLQKRTWKPLCLNGDPMAGWSQWFWGDAVFVRDIAGWKNLSSEAMLKMACILHDVYRSFDLAQLVLAARDQNHGTQDANTYFQALMQDVPELTQLPR